MDDLALYGSLPWESSPLTGNSLAVYPFSIAQSCVVILLNLAVVVAGIRSEMGFNAANVLSILMWTCVLWTVHLRCQGNRLRKHVMEPWSLPL
ncbi:hypothetical protein BC828DRAFT_305203 [Blastocladiella britannica]|nr:hypothetical protein BC828DRAFT_305203 [Blastocladiella britannica]